LKNYDGNNLDKNTLMEEINKVNEELSYTNSEILNWYIPILE